jgi:NAD-dependent DNA ligase
LTNFSVSKKTDQVVADPGAGPKLATAKKHDVAVRSPKTNGWS